MSTWKLITVLAKATGLQERDIDYAMQVLKIKMPQLYSTFHFQ
jgi:hypothetical protein